MDHPIDDSRLDERIRNFISQNLLYSTNGFTYPDDASFLEQGIIDSLGILQLVEFVQTDFRITVGQEEIVPDNFDSIRKLADFVRRKLQERESMARNESRKAAV